MKRPTWLLDEYLGADGLKRTPAEHARYLRQCAARWRANPGTTLYGISGEMVAELAERKAERIEQFAGGGR